MTWPIFSALLGGAKKGYPVLASRIAFHLLVSASCSFYSSKVCALLVYWWQGDDQAPPCHSFEGSGTGNYAAQGP